jgi:hypothetical protein
MDRQIGTLNGFAAANNGGVGNVNMNGGISATDAFDIDTLDNVDRMRARLATVDAGFYTIRRLDTMTFNDMVYAVRMADAPLTIKQ